MGVAIVWLIDTVLQLYTWVIVIWALMSWLVGFGVVNPRNNFVRQVLYFLDAVTEPARRPIRRIIPSLGGVDLSPLVLLLLIQFILIAFDRTLAPLLITLLG